MSILLLLRSVLIVVATVAVVAVCVFVAAALSSSSSLLLLLSLSSSLSSVRCRVYRAANSCIASRSELVCAVIAVLGTYSLVVVLVRP